MEDATGMQSANATSNKPNGKYVEGNHLYIIKDGTRYNVAGQKVK